MGNPVTLEEEFKKNPDLKKDEFNALKDWYSKQRHLPVIKDEMLALFFHSCHFNTEATKVTIDHYFTVRTHTPELFDKRDPFKTDVRNGKQVVNYVMLPKTTPKGDRVIFVKFNQTDPSDFNFAEAIRSFLMTADLDHYYSGTSNGFIIVFDMAGIVFGHLAKLNILLMKKILYYLQEAMPVRLTGLHFLNTVSFMDKILAMMKPFLKKDLMDNLHLHSTDFSKFYEVVPKNILPKEYGGDSPSTEELNKIHVKLRQENKKWFQDEEKQRVIESLRPGKAKNAGEIWGVEGSFKKLDLD